MAKVVSTYERPVNPADEVTVVWHIEDVRLIEPDFTDDQCREVLRLAKEFHDASVGLNWGVLEAHAKTVRGNA